MKIKRTVKESYLGIPLKYAGEVETIDENRMERIIRGSLATQRLGDNRTPDRMTLDAWNLLKTSGRVETFEAVGGREFWAGEDGETAQWQ